MDTSALVHHGCTTGHAIRFDDIEIVAKISSYNERLVRESLKICLAVNIIYRRWCQLERCVPSSARGFKEGRAAFFCTFKWTGLSFRLKWQYWWTCFSMNTCLALVMWLTCAIRNPDIFYHWFKKFGKLCFCILMKPWKPLVQKLDGFFKNSKIFYFYFEAELEQFNF